jgi:hypothetical protein
MRSGSLRILGFFALLAMPAACVPSTFSAANIGMLPGAAPSQAYVGEVPDLNDFWYNPAGLAYLKRTEAAGAYMDYLTSLKGGMAGFAAPGGRLWGYALDISYLSTGQVARTDFDDPTGGEGASFSFGELMGGISLGAALRHDLAAGAGLKFAREQTDEDFRTGLLADAGAAYRLYADRAWPARGFAAYATALARNILIVDDGGAASPAGFEAGVSLATAGATALSAGLSFYMGQRGVREVRAGLVALLSEDFRARLGYRRRVGENSDSAAGFSWVRGLTAGFGVRFGTLWLDYTYEDSSPLDAIHRFGITFAAGASH